MDNKNKKDNKTAIIIIIVVVAILALLFLVGLVVVALFIFGVFTAVSSVINDAAYEVGRYNDKIEGYEEHVVTSYYEYQRYFENGKLCFPS